MKYIGTLLICFFIGCSTVKESNPPTEVTLKIDSPIPVSVSIYAEKDCTDNWNFCDYN